MAIIAFRYTLQFRDLQAGFYRSNSQVSVVPALLARTKVTEHSRLYTTGVLKARLWAFERQDALMELPTNV